MVENCISACWALLYIFSFGYKLLAFLHRSPRQIVETVVSRGELTSICMLRLVSIFKGDPILLIIIQSIVKEILLINKDDSKSAENGSSS